MFESAKEYTLADNATSSALIDLSDTGVQCAKTLESDQAIRSSKQTAATSQDVKNCTGCANEAMNLR